LPSVIIDENQLEDGDERPQGVILKGTENEVFFDNKKDYWVKNVGIIVTQFVKFNILRPTIQDLIVYASTAATDRCEIFEELIPQYRYKNFVLRDYPILKETLMTEHSIQDYGISRCTSRTASFKYYSFKMSRLTPDEQNDCENAIHFQLRTEIEKYTFSLRTIHLKVTKIRVNALRLQKSIH
jgi:hypothetical protein